MQISQILKRCAYLFSPVFCLCLFLLFGKSAIPQGAKTAENVEFSAEATQLLEDIKTATQAYHGKLKSGVIVFELTLTGPTQMHLIHTEAPPYEEKGQWDITYQFDEEHQFYDVKARYKMALNGRPLSNWKETHHQYMRTGKTVHVWEKIGTEWKEQPLYRFEETLNPRRWTSLYSFTSKFFTPINVQKVNVADTLAYAITLRRTEPNSTLTIEMSLNPQKNYLPTRILAYNKSVMQGSISTPVSRTQGIPIESTSLTQYTYQLAQFEPDIWFPQIMRMERRVLDKNQQPKPPSYILTMQVQRAIFNIPIQQKNLPITLDK